MTPEVVGALAIKIYWKTIFWCHFVPLYATLPTAKKIFFYSQQEENFNIDHIWGC